MNVKRILIWSGASMVAILAVAAAVMAVKIGPSNILGMIRYDQREEGTLKVGDRLPDVTLVGLDGTSRHRLHDRVGGKPLVLIFGSFT